MLDKKNNKLMPADEVIAIYDEKESVHDQLICFTKKIKNVKMPSNSILLIQIVSYNEYTGQIGLLGVVVFPLFVENGK
jgi:hypothetical protein